MSFNIICILLQLASSSFFVYLCPNTNTNSVSNQYFLNFINVPCNFSLLDQSMISPICNLAICITEVAATCDPYLNNQHDRTVSIYLLRRVPVRTHISASTKLFICLNDWMVVEKITLIQRISLPCDVERFSPSGF